MRCRVKFLTATYLWTVLVFIVAKVCFMLFCQEGHDFSFGDMWQVISHGLTLDLSTALYFLILPFLVVMVSVWWQGKVLTKILQVYFIIIAFAFALAFVADTSLYPFWGFKLDASCLQYLDTPTEAMASVTTSYLILRLLAVILTTALVAFGYIKALQHSIEAPQKRTILPPFLHKASETVFYLICIPLIVIGIRGGLDESTTNIGQVYFSQNQFLNHSAVNPVFSFLASFEKTASNNVSYEFMDEAECEQIIHRLYNTESIDCDTLLNTQTPNIIVILMEGCGGEFTEISGRQDITPNLNRLAAEGIYFTNCYGNTWRTDRGTACTYSGYPSFPTMSVMKMPAKTRTLPCLARSLRDAKGYTTHYLYGGDINFTNMRSYLIGGGFEHLTWKTDYSVADQKSAEWGVRDDITFGTLLDMATSLPSPYLIGYSSLSSHEPWDVPIHQFDDEILNAFYYLDQCIGNFIALLRKSPAWQNTMVILLPDHGINYKEYDELHPLRNHIPMIWVGGAVKAPKRIETICNQTDLPATLLGQLGISHADYTYSRDVLSRSYMNPLAIHTYNNGFSLVDSTGFTVFDLNSQQTVKGNGNVNLGKAILQSASKDLTSR
jgi:phosphoglycerol transferase MdoB-like AlkP superfamily enzyme